MSDFMKDMFIEVREQENNEVFQRLESARLDH